MPKIKKTIQDLLVFPVIRGRVLGVNVYRGYAKLSDLSEISKADIYDQQKNPKGTQRDLSPKHAKEAFEYVKNSDLGFWPEVFLCARAKDALTFKTLSDEYDDIGILEIDKAKLSAQKGIVISRIDGNHRLHFADGKEKGYTKIEKLVSFCIAFNLTRNEEIQLFKDINKNQKPMNTSHLDGIDVRLTPEQELKQRNPALFIAQKLSQDSKSPLAGRIFEGGKKTIGADIPLRALKTGLEYMLSRSTQLPRLSDAEAQYKVIKNYFLAVKKWQPQAWSKPKEYIILRGAGFWAICFLGAQVIDRVLLNNKFDTKTMLTTLESGKKWDWSNKGSFPGMSGRGGALEISNKVARHLKDVNQISTDELFTQIMNGD
ncbi:DGQHR domain-containing protein [Paraflavitalea sp. CAU 1676]|uniref:DGQHR domain-containing protein n=1 Tax=Paraflavitalea sp. CAU 1676 TaxID=3032598 RepID=UPI0023DA7F08|nr:DGQHR domain-containing protein [Paraflavitalea sp. CAU 1676]MDF2188313.1 DGQHR domain-containing protein [Paraflavitalea sp. CAU 1676]